MVFSNASVLGVTSTGEFLGGTTARYRTVKTLQIEGYIDSRSSQTKDEGVAATVDTINQYISSATANSSNPSGTQTLEAVTINGFSMGNGKITSLDFEAGETGTDNQIFYGTYSASVQIFSDGDFDLLLDGGATISDSATINSFSESFSASLSETDEYKFSHSLAFQLFKKDTTDDMVERAKTIAETIFGETLSTFNLIIGDHYGNYNSIAKKLYNEKYNEVTGDFSFDLNFSLLQNNAASYSLVTAHSYDTDADGLVTVSEEGTIFPKTNVIDENVNTWLTTEITNSFSRSNTVYASYYDYISTNSLALNSKPIDVSKSVGISSAAVSYTVKYTNNEGFSNLDKLIERNISLSSQNSVATVQETGKIIYNQPKGRDFDFKSKVTSITGDASAILSRCLDLYNRCDLTGTLKRTSHKLSFSSVGKDIDYSYSFSDSSELLASGVISQKKIDASTEAGVPITQVAGVPNGKDALVQTPPQTTLGTRQVTAEATLRRLTGKNIFYEPFEFSTALNVLRQEMITKAFKVFQENVNLSSLDTAEIYISDANYSFSSERKLSANITVVFAQVSTIPVAGVTNSYYTIDS